MSETEKIKERYEKRKQQQAGAALSGYVTFTVQEREALYERLLRARFGDPARLRVLEIGAGKGANIPFFLKLGIPASNITANELLSDRFEELKKNFPEVNGAPGDALQLPHNETFDVVFQSTVFTSILDESFRAALAKKMLEMTRPGGIVLWYDFRFNNPSNPDVKKVTKAEVRRLFSSAREIHFYRVTLAPPISRRIGGLRGLVNSLFPFLRTHLVAEIVK